MTENFEQQELKERLDLIETMIDEGRRTTRSWGWLFVLWGIAYYVAFSWADFGHSSAAWPVTMIAAGVLTVVLKFRRRGSKPHTAVSRAIVSLWLAMGIALFLLMFSLAFSGRLDNHISIAIVGAMLGMVNLASSIILKWKMQFACAIAWLGAAEAACFDSLNQTLIAFLAATFLCQIVFGIYAMICETRMRGQHGALHA